MVRRLGLCLVMGVVAWNVVGCVGVAGTVLDGRELVATGRPFRGVAVESRGGEATVKMGPGEVRVTREGLGYGEGKVMKLPEGWRKMELKDGGSEIGVVVDGREVGRVRPNS